MKIVSIITIISFLFLALTLPVKLNAHSSGASLEKEVNGYFIDIGYDPIELTTDVPAVFDFNIQNKDGMDEPFTHLWLKISHNDEIYFASGIAKAQFGQTTSMLRLATKGEYKIQVRFSNQNTTLAEAEFPLTVAATKETKSPIQIVTLIVGVISGLILSLGVVYVWKKQKKE